MLRSNTLQPPPPPRSIHMLALATACRVPGASKSKFPRHKHCVRAFQPSMSHSLSLLQKGNFEAEISLKLAPAIKARWQRRDGPQGDGKRSVADASGNRSRSSSKSSRVKAECEVRIQKANATLKVTVQRRRTQQDP